MKLRNIVLIFLLLSLAIPCLFAGDLDDFEDDATRSGNNNDDDDSGDGCCLFDAIFEDSGCIEILPEALYESGKLSFDVQMNKQEVRGYAMLPIFSFDLDYHYRNEDIHAEDFRIEAGFGPFGLQYKELHFFEEDPEDELLFRQINYLHRMSDGEIIKVDVGLGMFQLEGNNVNEGFSTTSPIQVFPNKHISLFLRPSWNWINSNCIQEYKVGAMFTLKYVSAQAGYRFVRTGNSELDGVYFGLMLHY